MHTVALIEMPSSKDGAEDSSTALRWWTWTERIRTVTEMPFKVSLVDYSSMPAYQEIANKCLHLKELGLSNRKIALHLFVDEKNSSIGNQLD